MIRRYSTYQALVDCLCNLLPESRSAEKDPTRRTQPERDALCVLGHILHFDNVKALEAGVISRWLVQYPFGGVDASRDNNKKAIRDMMIDEPFYEDTDFRNSMRMMLWIMSNVRLLQKEMVEHGLLDVPKGSDITVNVNNSRFEEWMWD